MRCKASVCLSGTSHSANPRHFCYLRRVETRTPSVGGDGCWLDSCQTVSAARRRAAASLTAAHYSVEVNPGESALDKTEPSPRLSAVITWLTNTEVLSGEEWTQRLCFCSEGSVSTTTSIRHLINSFIFRPSLFTPHLSEIIAKLTSTQAYVYTLSPWVCAFQMIYHLNKQSGRFWFELVCWFSSWKSPGGLSMKVTLHYVWLCSWVRINLSKLTSELPSED